MSKTAARVFIEEQIDNTFMLKYVDMFNSDGTRQYVKGDLGVPKCFSTEAGARNYAQKQGYELID